MWHGEVRTVQVERLTGPDVAVPREALCEILKRIANVQFACAVSVHQSCSVFDRNMGAAEARSRLKRFKVLNSKSIINDTMYFTGVVSCWKSICDPGFNPGLIYWVVTK